MRPRVYVSRRVPRPVDAELTRRFELALHESEALPSRHELLAGVVGADGLVTMLTDSVDAELLDAAGPSLRVVANYAVGYDNVDVAEATRRGIVVANTPDVLTEATAEHTIALVFALLRRITEGDRFLRRREPWSWAPTFMVGAGVKHRKLGVIGFGRIGREVGRLGRRLGMFVSYTNRSGPVETDLGEWLPFEQLLANSDVVSLHCPLTEETHHLIGDDEFRTMRREAVLVNTARGPLVDEAALAEALRAGQIAGAALDVFEQEPAVEAALLDLENVVLTPHLGSATWEAREAMGMLCVEALTAVLLESRCPRNAVNPEAWSRA
jgi:glyoxylate reductase